MVVEFWFSHKQEMFPILPPPAEVGAGILTDGVRWKCLKQMHYYHKNRDRNSAK
jgi:hypothetical protein